MPSPLPRPLTRPWGLAALALLLLPATGPAPAELAPEPPRAMAALQAPATQVPQSRPGWGALYTPAAGAAYGLAVSRAGGAEARQAAEARCRRTGEGCRLLAEFSGRCGAVAQAVDREVLVALRPLGPASIRSTAAAGGESGEAAGRAALERCQAEGRGICVVVATACTEG